MPAYRLLDHTADLGFECDGKTREELFRKAILALSDIIARTDALSPREEREVSARGDDDPARLRALLEEVLFQLEKDAFLPKEAVVTFGKDGLVSARLSGEKVDLATHPIERVVKAVTWHGLEVKKVRGKLRARVILDL